MTPSFCLQQNRREPSLFKEKECGALRLVVMPNPLSTDTVLPLRAPPQLCCEYDANILVRLLSPRPT